MNATILRLENASDDFLDSIIDMANKAGVRIQTAQEYDYEISKELKKDYTKRIQDYKNGTLELSPLGEGWKGL